jgi:hypothetical protein
MCPTAVSNEQTTNKHRTITTNGHPTSTNVVELSVTGNRLTSLKVRPSFLCVVVAGTRSIIAGNSAPHMTCALLIDLHGHF